MTDPAPRTAWHDVESLRATWGVKAAPETDAIVADLLEVAKQQVLAYAPALPADVGDNEIPTNYVYAQYRRAREIYESSKTNGGGTDGDEVGLAGYSVRVARMSGAIKFILRPESAVPGIG